MLTWSGIVLGFQCPVFAQCDPPLPPAPPEAPILYSLNSQTVQANPDGSFLISNVSVPDTFPADGVGDDFLRVIATQPTQMGTRFGCPADDWTLYLYTNSASRMTPGESYPLEPSPLQVLCNPPPLPDLVELEALDDVGDPTSFVVIGDTRKLRTLAAIGGTKTMQDVTIPSAWTSYRISNSSTAVIEYNAPDPQQATEVRVRGLKKRTALITAQRVMNSISDKR